MGKTKKRKQAFSLEGSSSTTWIPSKKGTVEEIERLKSLGKRKIVVRKLIRKGNNFVEGKRVNLSNFLKK